VTAREAPENRAVWEATKPLFSEEALATMVLCSSDPQLEKVLLPHVDVSELLPVPSATKATWDEVRRLVPKAEERSAVSDWTAVLSAKGRRALELAALATWPARSKTDLAIRRTRFADWFYLIRQRDEEMALLRTIVKQGFDYIFVMNLIAALAVMGPSWMSKVVSLGAFDYDLSHFTVVTKKLSDIVKTRGLNDEQWWYFAEISTLAGYRNQPFPGFDPLTETRLLAEGGDPHNYCGYQWDELVAEALAMSPERRTCPSFLEFVTSAAWLTAGSSSVGKLEIVLPDGEVIKVKCRKNTVADVIDLPELAAACLTWRKQVNVAIVKSELGKIRMAVASDLYSYLQMSWINVLLNGAYNQWTGSTTDEDFVRQTQRMWRMLTLTARKLGLPFDFKAFDHQPTTYELQSVVRFILSKARCNCPSGDLHTFEQLAGNIVASFDESTLSWNDKDGKHVFRVTGGLMSGLRFTSLIGNAWNSVVTLLAVKVAGKLGVPTREVERFIRGDDSAIYTPNWGVAAGIKVGYDTVGVLAGEGKFSLQLHGMEFLRVWYSERCTGYPLRALPGLTQRKPWSSQPWSPDYVIRSIYDTCVILRRRLDDPTRVNRVWTALANHWCRDHNLPRVSLSVPTYMGGFGIEPYAGSERIVPAVSSVSRSEPLIVKNATDWRANRIAAYFHERYAVTVDAAAVAARQLSDTLTADDIPTVSKALREQWLEAVRSTSFRVVPTDAPLSEVRPLTTAVGAYSPENVSELVTTLRGRAPLFGAHPELATALEDYRVIRPVDSIRAWLKIQYPRIAASLRRFHRSWYRGECFDYLIGKLPVRADKLHPSLISPWQSLVAGACLPENKISRLAVHSVARYAEHEMWLSPLSQSLYRW